MTRRLPEAPGPTWAWVVALTVLVAMIAYLRLALFPDRLVPLAYGLPLLLFLWRRDPRLLWGTSAAFGAILIGKMTTLAAVGAPDRGETLFFGTMQLVAIAVTAAVIHMVIRQTGELDRAATELRASYAELEATNEELAAREEEINQQNEDLQSQTAELEHQAEELASQAEELQLVNEQLLARERALNGIVSLTGAGEAEVLSRLGLLVEQLLAPRASGAAILAPAGDTLAVHPLFGLATPAEEVQRANAFATIVATADDAAYVADLSQRPDIPVPRLASGERPRAIVAAPARVEGTEAIVLEVYSREPVEWGELELSLVQWTAEQAGRLWTTTRLRDDLARLADSERAARTQAERAAREKDEFVATLAHELRTPVGAVLGWASLLRTIAKSPEELEKGLEVIERNARQQSRLISDLLDMSRAVGGKLAVELRPVNLSEAANVAIDVVRPSADAKRIRLQREDDGLTPMVKGDADRLQQVIGNVLTNAIKFTPQEGEVRVRLSCDATSAHVHVTDTGKGIRPEVIPQLFDRYRQADSSSSRAHGGLGLGLAIARHLLELHGGSIRLSSDGEGLGTTCVISIPLAAPAVGAPGDAPRVARARATGNAPDDETLRRAIARRPILVVDDDPDTLAFVIRLFEEYGASVAQARSAQEALAMVDRVEPRLLVSDIGMPGMDGLELIRRIRHHPSDRTRAIPAIAMTAFTRPADRARALEAGFQAHVPKPLDPAQLLAMAATLCDGVGEPPSFVRA